MIWEMLEIIQAALGAAAPVREAGSGDRLFYSGWVRLAETSRFSAGPEAGTPTRSFGMLTRYPPRGDERLPHLERRLVPKQYAETQAACGLLNRTP